MKAAADPRFRLSCLALLLLLSTFAVPPIHMARVAYSVVAVLDITGSMNTKDQVAEGASISRLEMEKRATQELLAGLPCGSKLGIAVFVEERPFLFFAPVEVCDNTAPLNQSIAGIDWRMGWDSESHIAASLLASMVLAHGQTADVIFMTDGQETPPLAWSATPDFAPQRGAVHGVIVGIGGTELVPIPKFDKTGRQIGVWKPGEVPSETGGIFKGHEYLTAVDEPHLRDLAQQSGLAYLHLQQADQLQQAAPVYLSPRSVDGARDMRFIPAGAALFLLVLAHLKRGRRMLVPMPANRMRRPALMSADSHR